ncbi:hypothetical protein ANO14919_076790 [Xylariales sp. No.14919]|nr:hypothetical protein ANO14919_076790 [Xylariales sp. No.14919]
MSSFAVTVRVTIVPSPLKAISYYQIGVCSPVSLANGVATAISVFGVLSCDLD